MTNTNTGIGHIAYDEGCQLGEVLYAVIDEEKLPIAAELEVHRLADNLFIEGVHLGLYGIAIGGRSLDDAEVAGTHKRELQRARDGRSGERERVDAHLELAQLLLHRHTKLLLLVNDEQTEVLELHRLADELVRAHHDVHLTTLEALEHLLRVGSRAGTTQVFHLAGQVLQALREGAPMLIGQHGGGYEHRYLFSVARSLEGCTNRHLSLAEAHIATYEAVHGTFTFHVALDINGSLQLVGRIFVEEAGLQLMLQETIGAIGETLLLRTLRVEFDEVARDILNLCLGALLELLPSTRAEFVDAGCLALFALIF